MRYFIPLLLLGIMLFMPSQSVAAHVVLRSTDGAYAAVLHIAPGDDPIVGQGASLFFDVSGRDTFRAADYEAQLTIKSQDVSITLSPEAASGSTLQFDYSFPSAGVYDIALSAKSPGGDIIQFQHTQRTTRGSDTAHAATGYVWAEAVLVGTFGVIFVILILLINRWPLIAAFTRDEPKRRV